MTHQTLIGILGCPIRYNGKAAVEYFLTQRYAPKNPAYHLKWQLAGGGLEFGETPQQALVREFQEELNVVPEIIYPYPLVRSVLRNYPRRQLHLVLLSYIVSIGSQIPINTDPDHETADMGWFTFDQIQKLDNIENNLYFINQITDIINQEKLIKA